MFKGMQVFRVEFTIPHGSSSVLIAVESLDDVPAAIDEYEDRTGGRFVKFKDKCVMTPVLFVKEG